MNLSSFSTIQLYAVGLVLLIIVIGVIFVRIYKKTTKERAFVRTGLGGSRVILDGGSIVLPMVHDLTKINLNTLKLVVVRTKEQALITSDKLKVDVIVEFFIRVKRDKDSISRAASTLGQKTLNPDDLKDLIEGKLVDSLRSVASQTTMENLHQERKDFVQQVSNTVSEDLDTNGLELESVSLTSLDQTNIEYFNESNAFDAQGLKKIAEITEAKRKERVDIEESTRVLIERKRMETAKESLSINQSEEFAKAEQKSKIKIEQTHKARESREVEISDNKAIDFAIIQKDKELQQKEIEKTKEIESAKIKKEEVLKIALQDKNIKISQKIKDEAAARSEANVAEAKEAKTKEEIVTAREMEIAKRYKDLAIIEASQEAEKEAVTKKILALAEKEASLDKAQAVKIQAEGEAEAIKIHAMAKEKEYEVDAEGERKKNEALNALSTEQIHKEIQIDLIRELPNIIEMMVKPAEKIDSIKIVDMGNSNQNMINGAGTNGSNDSTNSLPEQLTEAMMNYKIGGALIDDLLKETGLKDAVGIENLEDMVRGNILKHKNKKG